MNENINQYVHSCPECQKDQAVMHKLHGLLQPLKPGYSPWKSIAMHFISDLPLSEACDQLWVIIDRFPKMVHFIRLKKKNSKDADVSKVVT
jgi:putative transposase